MKRGYTKEHFTRVVKKLRASIPDISITTDILTGFPGESEKQFLNTVDLVKKIEFDYAYLYKYSQRSGTFAAKLKNQVPEDIRLARLQTLIKIQNKITTKKYAFQEGKVKQVYVEGFSKKSNTELQGKTRDFKIVVFKADKSLIKKLVNVKILSSTGWTLKGEIV